MNMDPITQYLTAIKEEIEKDPKGLGYAGKSEEEQTKLLNDPYFIMVPEEQTPRIAVIINQIPFAPNAAGVDHVTASKKEITPDVIVAIADSIGKENLAVPDPVVPVDIQP